MIIASPRTQPERRTSPLTTFQLFCFRGTRPPALAGNNREADLMNSEAFFRSLFCGSSIFVHPSSFFVLCSLFFVGAGRGGEERLSEPCSKADSLVVVCCCGTNQRSTHHSLTTHHSPLTTHHSPLTTHHSPLTHHCKLITCQRSWETGE